MDLGINAAVGLRRMLISCDYHIFLESPFIYRYDKDAVGISGLCDIVGRGGTFGSRRKHGVSQEFLRL